VLEKRVWVGAHVTTKKGIHTLRRREGRWVGGGGKDEEGAPLGDFVHI
jgi:hypothetical protein